LNILFLSELFYPHGGGAELATYLYARLLSEEGFNVTVVTNRFAGESPFSRDKSLIIYRVPLFKAGGSVKYSILRRLDVSFSIFMRKLVKWASVVYVPRLWYSMIPVAKAYVKPVMVHIHDYMPICPLAVLYDSSKQAVCKSKGFCSPRCIYQFERNKNSHFKDSIMSTFLNLLAEMPIKKSVEQANAVLCVSKAQMSILVEDMPAISHKTRVIYNPLPDLSPIDIVGEDFGYFGGSNILKGFGVLCDAFDFLHDPSIKVHVTGSSNISEAMTHSLAGIRVILHKKLEYDKQEGFYRQIKGVIFPSIVPEPLPYVTAEAILRARILIASRIGGIPEQVKNCKGVFLFEAGNHRELAEIVKHVSGLNKEAVVDLGYQNREVFAKTFSNEKSIHEFINTINDLT